MEKVLRYPINKYQPKRLGAFTRHIIPHLLRYRYSFPDYFDNFTIGFFTMKIRFSPEWGENCF